MKFKQTFFFISFLFVVKIFFGFQQITITSKNEFQEQIKSLKEKLLIDSIPDFESPKLVKQNIDKLHQFVLDKNDV